MKHFTLALAAVAALALPVQVRAETPADTLVIADAIDDIVSLDPAESFEFSGKMSLNNVYDRLIHMHPAHEFRAGARACGELERQRRRHDLHLQDQGGR